jgi:predicted MPP superfamily phosphohydrolase
LVKKIDARNKTVLIISDLHIPYQHRKLFRFLKFLKKKYKPDIIIFLGDEVDGHSWSFHSHDSELASPADELKAAIKILQKVYKIFPKAFLLHSNHGSLLERKTKANGLPISVLKPLPQLYETPGWFWTDRIILQTKIGSTILGHGMSPKELEWAKSEGMSTVEGHYHTVFRLSWGARPSGEYYSMHLGCLINFGSLAFAYAKSNLKQPMIGSGIIHKDGEPELLRLNRFKL